MAVLRNLSNITAIFHALPPEKKAFLGYHLGTMMVHTHLIRPYFLTEGPQIPMKTLPKRTSDGAGEREGGSDRLPPIHFQQLSQFWAVYLKNHITFHGDKPSTISCLASAGSRTLLKVIAVSAVGTAISQGLTSCIFFGDRFADVLEQYGCVTQNGPKLNIPGWI